MRQVLARVRCECGEVVAWIERGADDCDWVPVSLDIDPKDIVYIRHASRPQRQLDKGDPEAYADPRIGTVRFWGEPTSSLGIEHWWRECFGCYSSSKITPTDLAEALDAYDRTGKPATIIRSRTT